MTMTRHGAGEFGRMLRLCRTHDLPEVTEGTSYGNPALQVKGKTFASLRAPGEMVLHCPLEQKDLLIEIAPEIYWQTEHFRGWPGLLVRLDVIGDEELALRLVDAWRFRAPKTLAAKFVKDTETPDGAS
jgi:hypothetical protein